MRIHIHASEGRLRRVLRRLASDRARHAIRRLRWMMPSVTMSLSRLAGAAGGLDKRCVVELETAKTGAVVMTSLAKDWSTAIRIAITQATRRVAELWRERVQRRGKRRSVARLAIR